MVQAAIGLCADKYGVREHITFDNGIVATAWHDDHWQLTDSTGASHTADVLVAALGGLHTPNIPPLLGLETFQGPMFHTSSRTSCRMRAGADCIQSQT